MRENPEGGGVAKDVSGAGWSSSSGRLWPAVSAACAAAAALCWWRGFVDAAFVTAALGVVAYFMNQRVRYRRLRDEHEHAQEQTDGGAADAKQD